MKVILEAQHAVGHKEPRGTGSYAISLIRALLRRRAFEYELAYFDFGREMGNFERASKLFGEYGVPMHECNALDYRIASRDDGVWDIKSYNEWTKTDGDVYHFLQAITVPLRLSGKMVVTIHDTTWKKYPGMISANDSALFDIAFSRIERLQPTVIAVSESARRQILEMSTIPAENINVVYQSYDEENLYPDEEKASSIVAGDYLLYLGVFEANKNIVRIISAFNRIADKHGDVKLVLAGKPTFDDPVAIYESVKASKFADRIILPGYVDVDVKRRLMSNALCFIFPSICEGFGIPVLEAMACGCPVITANNTSLPEVGGDAAIYVDAYDTEQLAHEMDRVIGSESLRREMIAKGFIQKTKFSWDKAAEQVENVYRIAAGAYIALKRDDPLSPSSTQ